MLVHTGFPCHFTGIGSHVTSQPHTWILYIGLLVSTKKRNSFLRYLKISRLLEKIGPADLNLYLCSYNSTADVPGQIHFRPVDRFFGQESL